MIPPGIELFFIILCIALHGFFSLAETSILTVRKSRLREIIDDPETPELRARRADTILSLKLQPEEFLAVVQSCAVLFSFLAAIFATVVVMQWSFGHPNTSLSSFLIFIIVVGLAIALDFLFGALIPKSIALHRSEPIALGISRAMKLLMRLLKPAMQLPLLLSQFLLRPFHEREVPETRMSEEEFRVMLEEGAESGAIDKTENELIENIFEFNERAAREVMIPRIKMVALDADMPRDNLIERIIAEGFTRMPVFQDTLDNILGVIYSKDVVALIEHPELIILYDIIRPVRFVPETKLLTELLREFQRDRLHMAIVVDEFGGTAGLITLEDLLEEIVGEIQDEYDTESHVIRIGADRKSMSLPADYSIADANLELEKIFPNFKFQKMRNMNPSADLSINCTDIFQKSTKNAGWTACGSSLPQKAR